MNNVSVWYKIKNFLFVLVRPHFWFSTYAIDWEWDAELRELLLVNKPEHIDHYFAKLGTEYLWIENYPYAFGSKSLTPTVDGFVKPTRLPAHITRKKLRKALDNAN